MKKEDRKKIRQQKTEELINRLNKEQKEALNLRMQKGAGKLKDLHSYSKKRKEIAVILTEIKKRELESEHKKKEGRK